MPRALLRILVTCTSSRETPNPEAEGEFALIPWGGSSGLRRALGVPGLCCSGKAWVAWLKGAWMEFM